MSTVTSSPSSQHMETGLAVFDPCGPVLAERQTRAARVETLAGLRLGVLDNTKWNAMKLLREAAALLQADDGVGEVRYYRKEAFSKPAAEELLKQIAAENDLVVTAIGDCGSCTSCCTVDAIALENLGVPTAVIVTTEFVHESKMQALALGMDDLAPVIIEHPLSALTSDQITQRAQRAAPLAAAIWRGDDPAAATDRAEP